MARGASRLRKQKSDVVGYLIIGVAGVVLLAVLAFLFFQSRNKVEIDAETGCLQTGPAAITVVILDMTDPLGPIQKPKIKNIVEEEKSALPKGGRLDFYTVDPVETQALTAQFSGCNPGAPQQITNQLTENPRQVEKKWTNFSNRVDLVLGRVIAEQGETQSPILEAVNSAAATSFGPYRSQPLKKRLVLLSDLMQYGKEVSFLKAVPNFDDFKKSSFYLRNRPDLDNVEIRIGVLARRNEAEEQMKSLINFWITMLRDSGGVIDHYQWISG